MVMKLYTINHASFMATTHNIPVAQNDNTMALLKGFCTVLAKMQISGLGKPKQFLAKYALDALSYMMYVFVDSDLMHSFCGRPTGNQTLYTQRTGTMQFTYVEWNRQDIPSPNTG